MKITVDLKDTIANLKVIDDDFGESLVRTMQVAAGSAIRDEAKARVPVKTGNLRNAIYLAYDTSSTKVNPKYTISWNKRVGGKHGHLIEFGHWNQAKTKWVPARPFLRPAYDALAPRLTSIMIERGKERFHELMDERIHGAMPK